MRLHSFRALTGLAGLGWLTLGTLVAFGETFPAPDPVTGITLEYTEGGHARAVPSQPPALIESLCGKGVRVATWRRGTMVDQKYSGAMREVPNEVVVGEAVGVQVKDPTSNRVIQLTFFLVFEAEGDRLLAAYSRKLPHSGAERQQTMTPLPGQLRVPYKDQVPEDGLVAANDLRSSVGSVLEAAWFYERLADPSATQEIVLRPRLFRNEAFASYEPNWPSEGACNAWVVTFTGVMYKMDKRPARMDATMAIPDGHSRPIVCFASHRRLE